MRLTIVMAVAWTTMLTSVTSVAAPPRLGGPLVDGSVVKAQGCGIHFFVAYRNEYALVEWVGGEYVKEGDVLMAVDESSELEKEGHATFTNLATGREIDIVIEKALMNREDYSLTVRKVCR